MQKQRMLRMRRTLNVFGFGMLLCVLSSAAYGQGVSKEQIKGLDEQVQEIKSDVLAIAAELNLLEETLLYPSDTQISLFLDLAIGERLRLDAVRILLDGQPVAQHLYTFNELEALRKGGVQRIYTGNIKTGEHAVQVSFSGLSDRGEAIERAETFKVVKQVGPRLVEITLAHQGITLNDR